jgi:hypothetical protein
MLGIERLVELRTKLVERAHGGLPTRLSVIE